MSGLHEVKEADNRTVGNNNDDTFPDYNHHIRLQFNWDRPPAITGRLHRQPPKSHLAQLPSSCAVAAPTPFHPLNPKP